MSQNDLDRYLISNTISYTLRYIKYYKDRWIISKALFFSDLLKKSSSGRIIFTSSLMSFTHRLTESNVAKNGIGKGFEYLAYGISKFCQISASEILAEKLKSLGITSNCFHPYAARTTLFKARYDGDRWYEHIHLFIMSLLAQLLGKVNIY